MLYLVSYDLNKKDKDYPAIIKELKEVLKATPVLNSQWVVESDMTSEELGKSLLKVIDDNDSLLVNSFDVTNAVVYNPDCEVKGLEVLETREESRAAELLRYLKRLDR